MHRRARVTAVVCDYYQCQVNIFTIEALSKKGGNDVFKKIIKKIIYSGGLLPLVHYLRNRASLTVIMLHRVLPENDPDWDSADPEWTVTTRFFEQLLKFVRRHFHVVSYSQVVDSYHGGKPLPPHALLITFDDGWRCNLQHAAPILKKNGLPSLLFVTTRAVGKSVLSWQETLYGGWKLGLLTQEKVKQICDQLRIDCLGDVNTPEELAAFTMALRALTPKERSAVYPLFNAWAEEFPGIPFMLNADQLVEIQKSGFELGTHGASHEALSLVDDPRAELAESRTDLQLLAKMDSPPGSLSFPQSLLNEEVLLMAREVGYECAFVGGKRINSVVPRKGLIELARHSMDQTWLENDDGDLDPARLSMLLFLSPKC